MKLKTLLVSAVALLCSAASWAYTGVTPSAGKTYFLYNTGANAYFVGTSGSYGTDGNIANATPVTVETSGSNFKLAYSYNGTTYRIYQHKGDSDWDNTTGVDFWFTPDGNGYKIQSKNPSDEHTRDMNSGVNFPKDSDSGKGHVTWQFISCDEVAETHYVTSAKGWEKVTSVSALKTSPQDYFFAIFSANVPGLILDATTSNSETTKPYYKTAANPLSSAAYLFEMETCGSGLALKSCSIDKYFANSSSYPWDYNATKSSVDSDCEITVTLADGAYTIQAKYAEGGNNYLGLWFPSNGYKNNQYLAGNKSSSNKGSFLIYRIAKENLSLTERIVNPDMETSGGGGEYWQEGVNGWGNCSNATNYRQLAFTEGQNPNGAFTGTNAFENWTPSGLTGQMSQTISNLPNGVYKLQLAALVRSVKGQFIYGKSNGNTYKTSLSGDNEKAYDYTVYVLVENNQLEIGLDMNNAGADWAAIDNARLTFLISSLPASLTGVSGKMNASVSDAQDAAIAAYNAVDGQTPSNYAAAIEAIANAEASIAAYAKAATYLSKVEEVLATTNVYTSSAYSSVYGTYKTAYEAGTLDDATADGLSYKVANYTGTERYDNNTANDLLIPGWTFGGTDAADNQTDLYINTWSTEGDGDDSNFKTPFFEYWTSNGNSLGEKVLATTISGLDVSKKYSLTIWARVRQKDGGSKESGSITMQVGGGEAVDLTAGTQVKSSQLYLDYFTAVGSTDGSGNLTVTINVAENSNISWLAFRNLTVTRLADDDDYSALNAAITAANTKTLGFETGEYAPYNNIAALTALAAAQAINQEADNTQASVNNTTTTLSGATWTANAANVECVYNGDFALADDGGWDRLAWTRSSNWGAAIPDKYGDTDIATLKAAGASTGYAFYNQPGSMQYGNNGLYTMPLKANTIYQLSFKYASESENSNESVTASVLNSGEGMAAKVYGANTAAYKTAGAFVTKTIKFVTGSAGNYVLTLANSGNTVITDVSITKDAVQTLTFKEDGTTPAFAAGTYPTVALDRSFSTTNYSTLALPFAMTSAQTSAAFDEVYEFDAVDGNSLKFVTASSITAGTPYLVKAKSSTLSVSNVAVDPSTTASNVRKSDASSTVTFQGTFSPIDALETDGSRYVVSSNNLYQVNSTVGLDGYRAYFISEAVSSAKSFVLNFDDVDMIQTVEAAQSESSVIYNLAGQRLNKAQKGVNIINGKKVLVK